MRARVVFRFDTRLAATAQILALTDLGLIYEWFYDFSRQLNVS